MNMQQDLIWLPNCQRNSVFNTSIKDDLNFNFIQVP